MNVKQIEDVKKNLPGKVIDGFRHIVKFRRETKDYLWFDFNDLDDGYENLSLGFPKDYDYNEIIRSCG